MDPASSPRPYPSIGHSFGIAGIVVGMMIVCAPVPVLQLFAGAEIAMLVYYVASMGGSFAIVYQIRKAKVGAPSFSFPLRPWPIALPLIVGSVVLLFGIVSPVTSAIPIPESIKQMLFATVDQTSLATVGYFIIAAPLLEELIFRGIMLDGLLRRHRPLTAILLSSVLFGAVHLNPWQFVTGLAFGLFAGWIYFRTASIGACILIHMCANGSGFVARLLMSPEDLLNSDATLVESYGGWGRLAASIGVSVVVLALCIIAVHFMLRRSRPPAW